MNLKSLPIYTTLINTWASYSKDALTLAVEYNISENAPAYVYGGVNVGVGAEATGFLLMANYAFTNKIGLTLRYNDWTMEDVSSVTAEESSASLYLLVIP